MAENNWHKIWNNKGSDVLPEHFDSETELFVFMKRLNGFDTQGGTISEKALMEQLDDIKQRLCKREACGSLYEVGCGSGANLLMFGKMGWRVGGIDYSEHLIKAAEKYLPKDNLEELICGSADKTDTSIKYDAVLSNSVFSYFTDLDYAKSVLEKINLKCRKSILLMDVHDSEKETEFKEFRKATIENYEKLYEGLPKLFYPRSFFEEFADKNGFDVEFYNPEVEGYWNSAFVYNVCFYRR